MHFAELPLRYSVVLSSTKFKRGSYPFNIPAASLPPANFTRMFFSKYLDRSRILSFLFFSFGSPWVFCCYKKYRRLSTDLRLCCRYNKRLPVLAPVKRNAPIRLFNSLLIDIVSTGNYFLLYSQTWFIYFKKTGTHVTEPVHKQDAIEISARLLG